MTADRMHSDELGMDTALITRLLAAQFPRLAALPLTEVRFAGADNAMFRLGGRLVVRLPRTPRAAYGIDKEQRWLPKLAPGLPLAVPVPAGRGVPGEGYPLPWSVYRWLDGQNLAERPLREPAETVTAALRLGHFTAVLRRLDATGAPSVRGGPLNTRDARVRRAIGLLAADGTLDAAAATAVWEAAVARPWTGAPVWAHGDLLPANILARDGELSAVIDFGGLGAGDPACDTLPAWTVFSAGPAREAFREAADVDRDTWVRGRGWALCFGLTALPHYRHTNPALAAVAHRTITEVLADAS